MTGETLHTPPPLYQNLRGTNSQEPGAPPSYEEAINPNGNKQATIEG